MSRVLIVAFLTACSAIAQQVQGSQSIAAIPPPESVVFRQFFQFIDHLEHEASVKDGLQRSVPAFYEETIGVPLSDRSFIREVARTYVSEVALVDREAAAAVERFRKQYIANRNLTPDLAVLRELEVRRTAVVTQHITLLRQSLSDASRHHLDAYITNVFAPQVRIATIRRSTAHTPRVSGTGDFSH